MKGETVMERKQQEILEKLAQLELTFSLEAVFYEAKLRPIYKK